MTQPYADDLDDAAYPSPDYSVPNRALDAAQLLADAGHHSDFVSSGEAICISGHCPDQLPGA